MKRDYVKKAFAKAANVQPSSAWNVFAKYGPHDSLGGRHFFIGIPGAEHTCVWHRNGKYLITTEPYRCASHRQKSLTDFCSQYGWRGMKSRHPGWWNASHTELWLLSPPSIGIDIDQVEWAICNEIPA